MWSVFLSSDEKNTLLGVGLRFREIFYEDRQYFRDMVSVHLARIIHELSGLGTMGRKAISLFFVFICFS
jgi:hypothetical protein